MLQNMSVLLLEVLIERKLGWGCFFVRMKAGVGGVVVPEDNEC